MGILLYCRNLRPFFAGSSSSIANMGHTKQQQLIKWRSE